MTLRCYPNVSAIATSETYQILSPVLFQQSLYFLLLIHRIFNLLVSTLFLHALQYYCIKPALCSAQKNGYLGSCICLRKSVGIALIQSWDDFT